MATLKNPASHPRIRDLSGTSTVGATTAVTIAGLDSVGELAALVIRGEISEPFQSSSGPRYSARELTAYRDRNRSR